MSSNDSNMKFGNPTAFATLASNPYAFLAEKEDVNEGLGFPTLPIHRDGVATATPTHRPETKDYPGKGLKRANPADSTINSDTRVFIRMMVEHPTAVGKKTFPFNIGRTKKGPFINVLTKHGTYRGVGMLSDLIEDGHAKTYVDPFKENTVWVYDINENGYEVSFFDFRWEFLQYYKRNKDSSISKWAAHLISAIKNKTPVYLDADQMFRTQFRNKLAPTVNASGWQKVKGKHTAPVVSVGSVAAFAVVAESVVPDNGTPKAAHKAAHKASSKTKPPASKAKGGPHGPMFIATERGHGLEPIWDPEGDRYTFRKDGVPFSRKDMKTHHFKLCRTPAGLIVYDDSPENKATANIRKRHLFTESLLYQSKNGDDIATQILSENWESIFSIKDKVTKQWVWSKTPFTVKSTSDGEEEILSAPSSPEISEKTSAVKFDYRAALKTTQPVVRVTPPPPARAPPLLPVEEVDDFPGLPQMTEAQKSSQEASKKAYLKMAAEANAKALLDAEAKAAVVKAKEIADAEDTRAKEIAMAEADKALALDDVEDPLQTAIAKAKASKAPVKLQGDALAALLGL